MAIQNKFRNTIQLLIQKENVSWTLVPFINSFNYITNEWSLNRWNEKNKFKSGICDDSSAIELSISFAKSNNSSIRYLTQSFDYNLDRRRNIILANRKALEIAKKYSNRKVFNALRKIFDFYPGPLDIIPKGNFHLWFGCELNLQNRTKFKLYLNPFCSTVLSPIELIYIIFNILGFRKESLNEIYKIMNILDGVYPRIIGIDFDKNGLLYFKVYFSPTQIDNKKIQFLLNEYGAICQRRFLEDVISNSIKNKCSNQELHFGLKFYLSKKKPSIKPYIYCNEFFTGDLHVYNYIKENICKNNINKYLLNNLNESILLNKPRKKEIVIFTFIGFGKSKIDVYIKPWKIP